MVRALRGKAASRFNLQKFGERLALRKGAILVALYSNDLRQKAIAIVKLAEHKTNVRKLFNISRNTLDI